METAQRRHSLAAEKMLRCLEMSREENREVNAKKEIKK
jgi:hypothetical protein